SGRETFLIMVGHKGRSVGLVGFNREGSDWKMRYQLVDLVEPYELPDDKTNPVRDLMREYVLDVYRSKLLTKVPISDHPLQRLPGFEGAQFVGAAKCQECHPTAHKTWSNAKHAQAWISLEK